jgi:hypothetical protein
MRSTNGVGSLHDGNYWFANEVVRNTRLVRFIESTRFVAVVTALLQANSAEGEFVSAVKSQLKPASVPVHPVLRFTHARTYDM